MRTLQEFKKFCKSELTEDIYALEQEREGASNRLIFMGFLLLAGAAFVSFCLFMLVGSVGKNWKMLAVPIIAAIGISAWISGRGTSKYKSNFKNQLIAKIVRFMDPSFFYNPDGCVPELSFRSCGVFTSTPDRYGGEDLVSGKISSTIFQFSEVYAEQKIPYPQAFLIRCRWMPIFQGFLFVADFNKSFKGRVLVLPDFAQRLMGRIGQSLQSLNKPRGQLVKLEDDEFEKHFVVYADDQVQARYVLSTSLMHRINNLSGKWKEGICLSFADSKVFLVISSRLDFLEPPLHSTLLDFEVLQTYFETLQLAIGVVKDLNLNTRIWTKE